MKKHLIYITVLALAILTGSCSKIKVIAPTFDVSVSKLTYRVNDTVSFKFSGRATYITFYSGEPGFNYANINRISANGVPQLQFTSTSSVGTEVNTLQLLATTSLDVLDSAHIVNAAWTDITSKATLSTGTASTPSGVIDLSAYAVTDKPLYLAFKYVGYQSTTSAQRTWVINTLTVNNVLPDGSLNPITAIADGYWTAVDVKNTAAKWVLPTSSAATISIVGGAVNAATNEDWIVTKPLILNKVAPDLGVSIQSASSNPLSFYNYIFKKAGTYTVTFVAMNNSIDDQKTAIKTINITITP